MIVNSLVLPVSRTSGIRKWGFFLLFQFRLWISELFPAVSVPLTTRQSLLYVVVGGSNELFLLWRPVLLLPSSSATSLNVFIRNCLHQSSLHLCFRTRISVARYSRLICPTSVLASSFCQKAVFAFEHRIQTFSPLLRWCLNCVQTANLSVSKSKGAFKQNPNWKQKPWYWKLICQTVYYSPTLVTNSFSNHAWRPSKKITYAIF